MILFSPSAVRVPANVLPQSLTASGEMGLNRRPISRIEGAPVEMFLTRAVMTRGVAEFADKRIQVDIPNQHRDGAMPIKKSGTVHSHKSSERTVCPDRGL